MKPLIELLKTILPNKISDETYNLLEKDLSDKVDTVDIRKANEPVERISVEVVAEPEAPDAHGHWYSKDTVEKGFLSADKAWREGRLNMNLFHAYDDIDSKNIELVKHYLVPFDCSINDELVKEGSWVAEVKYVNEDLWKKRTVPNEEGELEIAGLSLRGWGKINEAKVNE